MNAVKGKVRDAIYTQREELVGLAHDLAGHPELAFCEEYAAERLTGFLAAEGFTVRKGICGMPTAFVATIGHGPLHIAFCAEYDALPPACLFDRSKPPELVEVWLRPERQDAPVRHACGHNLIAGAAAAAAIGLRDTAGEAGLTVSVFGTPGEELYGIPEPNEDRLAPGKITLLEGGAFDGVHAVLMAHPFPTPFSTWVPTQVGGRMRARFSASQARPGRHALDVAGLQRLEETLKQAVLACQQLPTLYVARPEQDHTGAQADLAWSARSPADSRRVSAALRRCFEEAASSAGSAIEIAEYAPGALMREDPDLSAAYRKNSEVLGGMRAQAEQIRAEIRELFNSAKLPLPVRLIARFLPRLVSPRGLFMAKFPVEIVFGTDLGNVSQVIPAIHPFFGIGGMAGCHEAEFANQTETGEARQAMLDAGVALAWTALDAGTDPVLRRRLLECARPAAS